MKSVKYFRNIMKLKKETNLAERAKAIAKGENEFEVDGKKYPVKGVDKKDKENAKKFTNESKSMKLKDLIK